MFGISMFALPFFGEVSFGGSSILWLMKYLIWGLVAGIIIGALSKFWYDKVKYVYFGEVYKRRQDDYVTKRPRASIVFGKAGYFTKGDKTVFRIKYGMMPWQQIELINLPDPEHMVGNKAFFFQLNKDNYVQAKITIDWNKHGIKLEPVEDGMKFAAMIDLNEKDKIFETRRLTPITVGFIVMGFILLAGIIAFYFLSKAAPATPVA